MTRTLFNFLAVSLVATGLLAGAAFFAAYQTPGISRDNATIFFYLVQYFILASPLLPLLPSAFFFARADLEGLGILDQGLRAVGGIFVLLLLAGSLQFFGADRILEYHFEKQFENKKAVFEDAVRREMDLQGLRSFYEKDKAQNARKTLDTLKTLAARFPFDIFIERFKDQVYRDEWHRGLESKNPPGMTVIRGLENEAVELRNRREFAAAAATYEKCLKLIPKERPFLTLRERYELGRELNLRFDRDPAFKQTDKELREELLRSQILKIDETLKRGEIYQAYAGVRDLAVILEKNREIQERFLRVESEIRGGEFLVQDYLQWLEFSPRPVQIGKQTFQFGPYQVKGDRFVLGFKAVYLENAVVEAPGKKWTARYARILGNKIQIKNREFEKSEMIHIDGLDALHLRIPYLLPEYRKLVYFKGPGELKAFGDFSKKSLGQNDFLYRLYADAKMILPLTVLAFSLFLVMLSYRNRLHVLGPIYLLFLPLVITFFLFLEALAIYAAAVLGEKTQQPLLYTFILWTLNLFFLTVAIYKLARSRHTDTDH